MTRGGMEGAWNNMCLSDEFSDLPVDAGPAAFFYSFAVGGRRRIPEARRIATYGAVP